MRSVCLCVSVYRLSVCSHFLKRVPHIWWTKRIIEKSIFSQWNTFQRAKNGIIFGIGWKWKLKKADILRLHHLAHRSFIWAPLFTDAYIVLSRFFFIVNFKRERKYELNIFSLGQRGQHPLRYFSVYWINSTLDYFLSIQFHRILVGANDFMIHMTHDWLWSHFDVFYLAIAKFVRLNHLTICDHKGERID